MASRVSLRPVTKDNWKEVIDLPLHEEQQRFLHTNLYSLAEALISPDAEHYEPLAIYSDEELVGFSMHAHGPSLKEEVWIGRFMISANHQGRGLGKAALKLLLERLRILPCTSIHLTCDPENKAAQALYTGFGFQQTGRIFEGQEEWKLAQ